MALCLAPQKDNLLSITIDGLKFQRSFQGFDLSDFSRLEILKLSHWETDRNPGQEWRILAPRLRKFVWIFPDLRDLSFVDFGPAEADWLRSLVAASRNRSVAQSEIEVDYYPTALETPIHDAEAYPWDFIDALMPEFDGLGIGLS